MPDVTIECYHCHGEETVPAREETHGGEMRLAYDADDFLTAATAHQCPEEPDHA